MSGSGRPTARVDDLQYATARIGAILVTINPAYRSHELTYVLGHAAFRLSSLLQADSRRPTIAP